MLRVLPLRRILVQLQWRWYSGNVKSFNNKKGFGFIHPEFDLQNEIIDRYGTWKDVFIHYTDIDDDVRLLLPTTKVEFDCILEDSGPVAKHLKKIIPKRKRMIIEKWQDAPVGIDALVKKKELMDPAEWSQCLRDFYRSISSSSGLYKESHITVPEEQKHHLEYIDMANDLLSGLSWGGVLGSNGSQGGVSDASPSEASLSEASPSEGPQTDASQSDVSQSQMYNNPKKG